MTHGADDAQRRRAALFFELFSHLPREGPGDAGSTQRAYRLTTELPTTGRILDVGCGPGAQTLDLAAASDARIVALDLHRPYIDELRARVRVAGVSDRVQAVQASMLDLPFSDGHFDIVWAEGSIYLLGFERGLREWRRLLRPGGYAAVTHLSWLGSDFPEKPRTFWGQHYPAMRTVEHNMHVATASGYELVDVFTLPESAWWNDYYGPLEARLVSLRDKYTGDPESLTVLDETHEQIDLFRAFARYYGYVFYVLRARQPRQDELAT
jgi:SAM-dependent methyltransferase